MLWAALCLPTAADVYPKVWKRVGQMDELLEELVHVNDCFVRCVRELGDAAEAVRDGDSMKGAFLNNCLLPRILVYKKGVKIGGDPL
jgi:hypothetical protein